MTLALTIEINDGTLTPTGIVVVLLPGSDPTIPVELWRAADAAGVPDAANAVMIASRILPPGGIHLLDSLATDGTIYWYRQRLNGNAVGPGPYTDWVNLGAADRLSAEVLRALDTGAERSSAVWDQVTARPGTHSQQMLPNMGLEDGFIFLGSASGAHRVVTDSIKAHSGNNYLEATSTTGNRAEAAATDDAGNQRFFEVSPGDVVQWGGWAYRESGTANVGFELVTQDKDKGGSVAYFTPNQNTAAWGLVQGQLVIPAGVKYVRWFTSVDNTGTGTVARFDDVFLRIAFGASTVLNPQASVLPTPMPGSILFTFNSGGDGSAGSQTMWIAWTWSAFTIRFPDDSTISVPASASLPAPPSPTLSQIAGGSLGARTYFCRLGYVKNDQVMNVGAEASFAVSANNRLTITSPAAVAGYDGWVPLIGTATNTERYQTPNPTAFAIAFGTDYTEPTAGATTTAGTATPYDNTKHPGAIITVDRLASTTYLGYPYWDLAAAVVAFANQPVTSGATADQQAAEVQKQNRDGRIGLAVAVISVTIGAAGAPGSGSGGGRYK